MAPTIRSIGLWGLALLALAVVLPGPAGAQEANQAGLVVQFEDGHLETRCLPVNGDGVKGVDLLKQSGLDLIIDSSGFLGVTLCKVEDQGCDFPAQPCFCQCMGGGPCAYWNYFYRDPGSEEWVYSPLGAVLHVVKPGSVDAWVWGDGRTPPTGDLTFEAICAQPTAAPAAPTVTPLPPSPGPTDLPATDPAPQATPVPASPEPTADRQPTTAAPAKEPSAMPTVLASPTPGPIPGADAPGMATYLPFGLMVLGLAAIAVVVWLRRK